jgi:excinuclease ABC subunit A
MSIRNADQWFRDLDTHLNQTQKEIAARILKEIRERLKFLNNVGLEYLTLSRSSATLSGGESQRIRLASQIGSGLSGVLYVLDEPSIGLHQRDNSRLLDSLRGLRDLGNTVIVVEHDEEAIRTADYVIDMGPGAGVHGGKVVVQGTPAVIAKHSGSLTGSYLSGRTRIEIPPMRTPFNHKHILEIIEASGNNLKNISVEIPVGLMTCITGVSGSGKSTLINRLLGHEAQATGAIRAHDGRGQAAPQHNPRARAPVDGRGGRRPRHGDGDVLGPDARVRPLGRQGV